MGTKLTKSIEQKRTNSNVVRGAIIFAVAYATKEFMGLEIDDRFIEACVILLYGAYNIFAAYNNPKSKDNF